MRVIDHGLLCSVAIITAIAAPADAATQVRRFDVKAQPARTGIPAFAHQAGIQILATKALTDGLNVNRVKGTMPVQVALQQLLAGTGLVAIDVDGAVALKRRVLAAATARDVPQNLAVSASPIDDAAPTQAGPASEQAAAAEPDDQDIVVTGFRRSLQNAQANKRRAVNTIESIMAEDIAKLPDLNLAESIQRLPGVAISREGGEGRNITLRGFAPDFTRTTLNGMEVPASSDGLDSGGFTVNAGRAFDFHVFASELFNRIDIQKTQTASIEEGGIAGTVDLYSSKPFDNPGFNLFVSGQGGYNSLSRTVDPRFAAVASNTFADDRIGVLVSAAYSERTVQQEGYSSVLWTSPFLTGDSWADTNPRVTGTPKGGCGAADPLDCLWAPRLPRADFFGNNQKRFGITGSLQFKPVDGLLVTFDALHSELENDRFSYNSMEWLLTHGPAGNFVGQTPVSFTIAPDGKQLIAASFNDVTSWYESRHQKSKSDFNQFVLSSVYDVSDRVKLDALLGKASDDADRTELRFYARSVPHPYSYDYSGGGYVPVVGFGNYDPGNAANYINALTAANRINTVLKENYTGKLNLTYADDAGLTAKTGFAYNNRKVRYREGAGANVTFAPAAYLESFPYRNFGRDFGGVGLKPFAVVDFDAIADAGIIPAGYTDTVSAGWTVGEETLGGYVELNGRFDLGGMQLRANTGLRYVKTNLTSQATIGGTPVEVKRSYQNYLPSMNFALDITDTLIARLAYSRSLTRPGLSTLNIAGPVFGYTTRTVGNLGNPDLQPYQSNDIDAGLEWYFGRAGLLAVNLFNKDITTSLTTQVVSRMIDPAFWPAIYADPQYDPSYNADPAKVPYTFTIPVNAEGGNSVKGIELTYNQPFTFLPGTLRNLGLASNYTHVSARDATGLSRNSYNVTLYYDSKKVGARISANKRDDYLLIQPGSNGNLQERKYGPTHVDFSAFYNVTPRLTISLEGINITDEVERIYGTGDGTQDLTREYTHTGAQWFVGARFRF